MGGGLHLHADARLHDGLQYHEVADLRKQNAKDFCVALLKGSSECESHSVWGKHCKKYKYYADGVYLIGGGMAARAISTMADAENACEKVSKQCKRDTSLCPTCAAVRGSQSLVSVCICNIVFCCGLSVHASGISRCSWQIWNAVDALL